METMDITRVGSQPSAKGPDEWFTGTVRIDPLFQANAPARAMAASVTFEPGARTAWHTHPLGQTLIVTAGVGRVQREGGPVEEIRPGDVIWFPLVPVNAVSQPQARRRILEAARATGSAKASAGATAARSQDFLYGDDGLPE